MIVSLAGHKRSPQSALWAICAADGSVSSAAAGRSEGPRSLIRALSAAGPQQRAIMCHNQMSSEHQEDLCCFFYLDNLLDTNGYIALWILIHFS